jgi:mannose-6-phosphate isomerase
MTMTKVTGSLGKPFRLAPTFAARIWGRDNLKPWYDETGLAEKVGEAWLTGPMSVVETGDLAGKTLGEIGSKITGDGAFPLLVKILFPNEKLSVQVHPDDAQAQRVGLERGKTECWYVLAAEPGATVACGLVDGAEVSDVEKALEEGTLESLLKMVPVKVGDMVFVDAGTVHAIGPGVTLLEVQQTCDVTYRLYDYGRPRELHLKAGLAVVKIKTEAGLIAPRKIDGFTRLIEAKYFVVDRHDLEPGAWAQVENPSAGCIVGLAGSGLVDGVEVQAGRAVVLPVGACRVESSSGLTFAFCWEPIQG